MNLQAYVFILMIWYLQLIQIWTTDDNVLQWNTDSVIRYHRINVGQGHEHN